MKHWYRQIAVGENERRERSELSLFRGSSLNFNEERERRSAGGKMTKLGLGRRWLVWLAAYISRVRKKTLGKKRVVGGAELNFGARYATRRDEAEAYGVKGIRTGQTKKMEKVKS